MKIQYNPAVDLCCAMLQYADWDEKVSPVIPGYTLSSELADWYKKSRLKLSGLLNNDISYLIRNFLGLIFLPIDLAFNEEISEVPRLIQVFRLLPSESLPERVFTFYDTEIPFKDVCNNPEKITKVIEKAGGTTRSKEAELFLDFMHNPAALQVRLAGMMEEFYNSAFKPFEKTVSDIMQEQIKSEQDILDSDPERFFNGFLRMKNEGWSDEPVICISFYNEIDIIQMDNPDSIIYGRCRSQLEGYSSIPVEQIYKLLSDDSRRLILKLLCRKSWFLRELADELDLTSATVSYHMSKLAVMNLVRFKLGERKRTYYSADIEVVSKMLKTVEKDILG